jgi:hypothetical protein
VTITPGQQSALDMLIDRDKAELDALLLEALALAPAVQHTAPLFHVELHYDPHRRTRCARQPNKTQHSR